MAAEHGHKHTASIGSTKKGDKKRLALSGDRMVWATYEPANEVAPLTRFSFLYFRLEYSICCQSCVLQASNPVPLIELGHSKWEFKMFELLKIDDVFLMRQLRSIQSLLS